jgi:hypothetical protein
LVSMLASSAIDRGCRYNYISGVLASMLASSAIDRGCRYNYIGGVLALHPRCITLEASTLANTPPM